MLSLALFACSTSVFVKGVVSDEEEKNTDKEKEFAFYKKYKKEPWVKARFEEGMVENIENTIPMLKGLGEDPNMLLNSVRSQKRKPHNVIAKAAELVPLNAENGECKMELIEMLRDLGGNPEEYEEFECIEETLWGNSPNERSKRRWMKKVTNSAKDIVTSLTYNKNSNIRLCAKKIKRLFLGITELTSEEKACQQNELYRDMQKDTQKLEEYEELIKEQENR